VTVGGATTIPTASTSAEDKASSSTSGRYGPIAQGDPDCRICFAGGRPWLLTRFRSRNLADTVARAAGASRTSLGADPASFAGSINLAPSDRRLDRLQADSRPAESRGIPPAVFEPARPATGSGPKIGVCLYGLTEAPITLPICPPARRWQRKSEQRERLIHSVGQMLAGIRVRLAGVGGQGSRRRRRNPDSGGGKTSWRDTGATRAREPARRCAEGWLQLPATIGELDGGREISFHHRPAQGGWIPLRQPAPIIPREVEKTCWRAIRLVAESSRSWALPERGMGLKRGPPSSSPSADGSDGERARSD